MYVCIYIYIYIYICTYIYIYIYIYGPRLAAEVGDSEGPAIAFSRPARGSGAGFLVWTRRHEVVSSYRPSFAIMQKRSWSRVGDRVRVGVWHGTSRMWVTVLRMMLRLWASAGCRAQRPAFLGGDRLSNAVSIINMYIYTYVL